MNVIKLSILVTCMLLPSLSQAANYSMQDYSVLENQYQEQSNDSNDPCVVVLCMFGKATGNSGGDGCKSPEKKFFNIIKKKKGSFLSGKTADARKAFLNQCTSASADTITTIIKKFGKVRM
ncbi:KikA protein [Salmonella enterica]|nr:KikA protein [Salmonella enterica]